MSARTAVRSPRRVPGIAALAALLAMALGSAAAHARPKTDVIYMDNGDRITGEIKGLTRGILTVSTDSLGTVSVEWIHVASVATDVRFQVEMADGAILLGTLAPDPAVDRVLVEGDDGGSEARNEIVRLAPIEDRLRDRFQGSASVGASYSQGGNTLQTNAAFNSTYFAERYQAQVSASWNSTSDSEGNNDTQRGDLGFMYRRLRPNRWFGAGFAQAQRNEELGVDLRVSAGGGVGRFLVQSDRTEFIATGGLALSRQWSPSGTGSGTVTSDDLEGVIVLEYDYFVLDSPEVTLSSDLSIYPGLSNWGSLRSDFDASLSWEIVNNLFWALQVYLSYDNDTEPGAANSDYGYVTSLGYKF
jgi:hypothetical protein